MKSLRHENSNDTSLLKFIFSEKTTKFCEISTADLTFTTQDKSKVVISQIFCGLLTKPQLYQLGRLFLNFGQGRKSVTTLPHLLYIGWNLEEKANFNV